MPVHEPSVVRVTKGSKRDRLAERPRIDDHLASPERLRVFEENMEKEKAKLLAKVLNGSS